MQISLAFAAVALIEFWTTPATAQSIGSPLIDYQGITELTVQVQPYRSTRLIPIADFQQRASQGDVLILDARSAAAFKAGHLKGAVNLPLPDFTAEALAEIVGTNPNREILIYCNNNFINNRNPVMTRL